MIFKILGVIAVVLILGALWVMDQNSKQPTQPVVQQQSAPQQYQQAPQQQQPRGADDMRNLKIP